MGKSLYDHFPEARKVFETADRIVPSLSKICFEGPDEILRLTVNAQAAIFAVSAASWSVFSKMGKSGTDPNLVPTCVYAAGHSVGEYGALVAAGTLTFEEGLRLVRKRGELMYESGLKRPGTMTAILGLPVGELESICKEAGPVEIANFNTPTQIVISGEPDAVAKAGESAKAKGAKRVIPLPVSGAFHSRLMEDAARALSEELDKTKFRDAQFPVVSNVTASPVTKGDEIRTLLKRQIRERVRWEETIQFILNQGITAFVEMEPGNILTGLVRSIDKTVKTSKLMELLSEIK